MNDPTFKLSDDGDAVLVRRPGDPSGEVRIVAVDAHHPIVPSYAFFLARIVFCRPAEAIEDLARRSYESQQEPRSMNYLSWDDPDLDEVTRAIYRRDVSSALLALVQQVLDEAKEQRR